MKNKLKKVSNHLGIEIIFLFSALSISIFSIYLKYQAENKIIENETFLYNLEVEFLENSDFLLQNKNVVEQFNNHFTTYTYFNEELKKDFESFFNLLNSDSPIEDIEFVKTLSAFITQLKIENKRINFGYDSLIYSSLILITATLILIIINNTNQNKEIEKLNIHHEEQLKISQELHDGVSQDISALLIFLEQKDIEKCKYVAKSALSEIRFMIGMQNIDLSAGFESILRNTVTTFEQNYGIKTDFLSALSTDRNLSAETQLELIRIVQEALNNVAHHSKATYVTVKLLEVDKHLKLCISDNGIGLQTPSPERKHYGLNNIERRAKSLGGTFQIKSENGTTILVSVPNK